MELGSFYRHPVLHILQHRLLKAVVVRSLNWPCFSAWLFHRSCFIHLLFLQHHHLNMRSSLVSETCSCNAKQLSFVFWATASELIIKNSIFQRYCLRFNTTSSFFATTRRFPAGFKWSHATPGSLFHRLQTKNVNSTLQRETGRMVWQERTSNVRCRRGLQRICSSFFGFPSLFLDFGPFTDWIFEVCSFLFYFVLCLLICCGSFFQWDSCWCAYQRFIWCWVCWCSHWDCKSSNYSLFACVRSIIVFSLYLSFGISSKLFQN